MPDAGGALGGLPVVEPLNTQGGGELRAEQLL